MGHHQPKAPDLTSARTSKQGPNPLPISGHSPETLQLPSRQPTMAWVLARHGSDDMSGVHVINHHRYNEQFIQQRTHLSTPPSPSHSAHTAQLGRLEKNSPTMRQHSSKQMYTKLLLRHNKSKTLAHIEFIPLASPAESSKIRTTCAARLSNIFHLFSNTNPEQRR